MLSEKTESIKHELIGYANLVEAMIEKGIHGLIKKDKAALDEIIRIDEPKANQWEIALDEMGTHLIAQFEPKAKELRLILMILKMTNDLERMADQVVNICGSSLFLVERPPVKPLVDIPKMAKITTKMLKDSITSFIKEDVRLAKEICERDDEVDQLRDQIYRELIPLMTSDPTAIERALHLMRIAANFERIADLTTNICEDIIFAVEGKIIKHHHLEKEGENT